MFNWVESHGLYISLQINCYSNNFTWHVQGSTKLVTIRVCSFEGSFAPGTKCIALVLLMSRNYLKNPLSLVSIKGKLNDVSLFLLLNRVLPHSGPAYQLISSYLIIWADKLGPAMALYSTKSDRPAIRRNSLKNYRVSKKGWLFIL